MLSPTRTHGLRVRPHLPARRDEDGMTLVELMVAMIISLILIVTVGTMVTVFTKAEASTVNSANAAAATRLTLFQFQHDVQSAVPIDPLSTCTTSCPSSAYTAYDDTLEVTVQPSGAVITWQYSPTTEELTRTVGTALPVVELTDVTNGDPTAMPNPGIPVFHFFNYCGADLVQQAQASGSAPSSIASDATVVEVTLAEANLDSAPYGTTTSVNVMNKAPGITPC